MTAFLLVVAALLGQTTQPADPRGPRPPGRRVTVATRPASTSVTKPPVTRPPTVQTPATRPSTAITPAARPPVTRPLVAAPPVTAQPIAAPATTAPSATERRPSIRVVPTTRPTAVVSPIEDRSTRPVVAPPATLPADSKLAAQAAQVSAINGLTGGRVQVEVTETGDIVIIGDPQDVKILEGLVAQMENQPGLVPEFKVFQLKNAQAVKIAQQLQNFWNEAKKRPTGGVRPEDRVNIIPEPRANLLMVATGASNMAEITSIINQLDQPLRAEDMPVLFQQIQLKNIKAEEAELLVRDMLKDLQARRGAEQAEPATIRSDTRTNSLLVSASQADFETISKLVDLLDVPPIPGIASVKLAIFPLKKASAESLVKAISDMLSTQPASGAGTGAQNKAVREQIRRLQIVFMGPEGGKSLPDLDLEKQVRLFPESGTNSVIVAAAENNIEPMRAIIEMLDSVPLADEITVRMYPLQFADAEQLSASLDKIFQKGPELPELPGSTSNVKDRVPTNPQGKALAYSLALAFDKRTNTLLIAGRPEQMDLVDQVVAKMDVKDTASHFTPQLVKLDHADVKAVADVLQKLIEQRQKLVEAGGANSARLESISLLPDQRSNSLIVVANADNVKEISDLARQLDGAEMSLTGGAQLFQVQNADVVRVGDMLEQLLKGIQATVQDPKQLQYAVVSDPRTRTVLVSGTRDALKQAELLMAKLDVLPGEPTGETRVYTLKQASARQLQQVLTDLFEQRQQGGGTSGGTSGGGGQVRHSPVMIQSVEGSNDLIVTASAEEHAVVKDLLKTLDRPSTMAQQLRVFPLAHARADALADTLDKLLREQAQGGGTSKGANAAAPVAITPETRTNSLIVYASPDILNNIGQIVQNLDTTQTVSEMGLKVFKLRNAGAEDLAKRLDEFFKNAAAGGTGGTGGKDGGRQMIIHFTSRNPDTGAEEQRVLVHEDVTVTPDPATNSLMVLAPRDSIGMMERLVYMLDAVELRTAEMRVFQLRNADAEDMRKTLEELFKVSGGKSGTEAERTQLRFAGGGAEGVAAPAAGPTTPGPEGGLVEIAFSVDKRTNSLIAAGSSSNLKTVERLVDELDTKDQEERIVRVVHLRYATAKDVATAMKSYFDQESGIVEKGAEGESETRKTERQVTVQEAGSIQNTLLLSYSQRMESQVIGIVDDLDLPPPQVMIQVLIAEVTLTESLELGIEFALQDLNFSQHSFTTNGVLQGSGFDRVFGVDLGAQGQSGLGGISFTITGEDFNFLVRALQTEGRLDVLSRPSILVQDSQDANITVGSEVPTVTDISVSTNGQIIPAVSYKDVGIKLDVTPIINPDGFVNLKIKPEISAIGTSTVTVASGVSLPTFTTRNAETSVTVKDGETVIIGGLITNTENNTENKVPLAGDLPLLGNLFRATVKNQTKTELLMVLTPHVIRSAEQARQISVQMRDASNMIDDIRRNPLMGKLQVTPEEEFGPSGPVEGAPARPERPAAEEYGPVSEEYGPPTGALRKNETEPDMATFRIRKPSQPVLVPSPK